MPTALELYTQPGDAFLTADDVLVMRRLVEYVFLKTGRINRGLADQLELFFASLAATGNVPKLFTVAQVIELRGFFREAYRLAGFEPTEAELTSVVTPFFFYVIS